MLQSERPPAWPDRVFRRVVKAATGGIPIMSPQAAGLFRIVYGSLMLLMVWTNRRPMHTGLPIEGHRELSFYLEFPFVHELIANHTFMYWTWVATLVGMAFLTIGFLTRLSHLVAFLGLLMLVAEELTVSSAHNLGLPLFILAGLLLVSWHHGLSLDSALRKWLGRVPRGSAPSRQYGFVVWLPAFMIGVAFLAAAYAKLARAGLEWVTTGSVRYHLMEDAHNAVLPIGYWLAGHPRLAAFMSLGVIVIEAAFILIIFFRNEWIRFIFGLLGFSLMAGFYLFMGIFWHAWWILFTCCLPWTSIWRALTLLPGAVAPAGRSVRGAGAQNAIQSRPPNPIWFRLQVTAQVLFVLFIVGQQAVMSSIQKEYEPFFSDFPMYSSTHASPEAFFDRLRWVRYQQYYFVARTSDGALLDVTGDIEEIEQEVRNFTRYLMLICRDMRIDRPGRRERFGHVATIGLDRLQERYDDVQLTEISMFFDQKAINWEGGGVYWRMRAAPVATLTIPEMDLVREEPEELQLRMTGIKPETMAIPRVLVDETDVSWLGQGARPAGRILHAPIQVEVESVRTPLTGSAERMLRRVLLTPAKPLTAPTTNSKEPDLRILIDREVYALYGDTLIDESTDRPPQLWRLPAESLEGLRLQVRNQASDETGRAEHSGSDS